MASAVSVIVPVYNEAASLAAHLGCLRAYLDERFGSDYEVVVVDDGSTDGTPGILRLASAQNPRLQVRTHDRNRGISAAIRTGIAAARGEYIVTFDADLTYAPPTIGGLVDQLDLRSADIALASPFLSNGACRKVPWLRRLLSICANRFLSYAVRGRVRTLTCLVRAYRAQVIQALLEEGRHPEVTFGVVFAAYRAGYRIVELPATLDWSRQPRRRTQRTSYVKIAHRTWEILMAGVRMRPITLLAVPGIVPGLLPAVAAGAVLLRLPRTEIVVLTACTLAVQCASLAFATLMLADSFAGNSAWKRVICSLSSSRTIKTIRGETLEPPSAMLSSPYSLRER
jgi:Glycosyl transferase family 2